MIPTKQTVLHDPASGKHGNCLSAVLASLLEIDIAEVPVFSNPEHWVQDMNAWLSTYGLAYISFPVKGYEGMLESFGIKGLHHEIGGMTNRFSDVGHSCIGEDGKLVFDPHPSNDGLNAGIDNYGVFLALKPWNWKGSK